MYTDSVEVFASQWSDRTPREVLRAAYSRSVRLILRQANSGRAGMCSRGTWKTTETRKATTHSGSGSG